MIVILGLLAAIAVPRYVSYVRDARIAALNGLAGAIRSSVELVKARYVMSGAATSPVTMQDGTTVSVRTTGASAGIPRSNAGGINNAVTLGIPPTFVYTAGGATGTYNFPTAIANCRVTYTAATGAVTVVTTGC